MTKKYSLPVNSFKREDADYYLIKKILEFGKFWETKIRKTSFDGSWVMTNNTKKTSKINAIALIILLDMMIFLYKITDTCQVNIADFHVKNKA